MAGLHKEIKAETRFREQVEAAPEDFKRTKTKLEQLIREHSVLFGGKPLPTSVKPHFMGRELHQKWVARCENFTHVLEMLGQKLVKSPEALTQLGFSVQAIELITIDSGVERVTHNTRPDCLWKGDELRLIEFNSDSPAMMTYTDRLQQLIFELPLMAQLAREFDFNRHDRTAAFLSTILDAYRKSGGTKDAPTVAIVDWPGQKTANELLHTSQLFTKSGVPSFVCSPDELSIRKGKLCATGREIDVVQRRILFPDFLSRPKELAVLLRAYREQLALVINPLNSYVVGNKGVLAMIADPSMLEQTDEVRAATALLPESLMVDDEVRYKLLDGSQEQWVLKPTFGYGGQGVLLGDELSKDEWKRAVAQTKKGYWLAQALFEIPTYELPDFDGDTLRWKKAFINWTPWLFAGRFAGGTTRASSSRKVSITQDGALLLPVVTD